MGSQPLSAIQLLPCLKSDNALCAHKLFDTACIAAAFETGGLGWTSAVPQCSAITIAITPPPKEAQTFFSVGWQLLIEIKD